MFRCLLIECIGALSIRSHLAKLWTYLSGRLNEYVDCSFWGNHVAANRGDCDIFTAKSSKSSVRRESRRGSPLILRQSSYVVSRPKIDLRAIRCKRSSASEASEVRMEWKALLGYSRIGLTKEQYTLTRSASGMSACFRMRRIHDRAANLRRISRTWRSGRGGGQRYIQGA